MTIKKTIKKAVNKVVDAVKKEIKETRLEMSSKKILAKSFQERNQGFSQDILKAQKKWGITYQAGFIPIDTTIEGNTQALAAIESAAMSFKDPRGSNVTDSTD